MPTTTDIIDRREVLDRVNFTEFDTALRGAKLGTMFCTIKAVFAGVTGAATYDITTAAMKALATITGINLATGENLPAIGHLLTLRVTAATTGTVVGTYILTDVAGTVLTPATSSAVGIARISDDGTTLTFASADVTAFIIEYTPRVAVSMTAEYGNGL